MVNVNTNILFSAQPCILEKIRNKFGFAYTINNSFLIAVQLENVTATMWEWMYISPFCYQHPYTTKAAANCLRDEATNFRDNDIITHRIKHLILDTTLSPGINIDPEWCHYKTVSNQGISSWKK